MTPLSVPKPQMDAKPEKASDAIVFHLEKKNVVLSKKLMVELERNRRIDKLLEDVKVCGYFVHVCARRRTVRSALCMRVVC